MTFGLESIDLSSLTNLVPSIMGSATTNTTKTAAIINPSTSSEQLTTDEQQIYEQGEARIKELCEQQRKNNEGLLKHGLITQDMVELTKENIEAIRNTYIQNHPEYAEVLNKKQAKIKTDA